MLTKQTKWGCSILGDCLKTCIMEEMLEVWQIAGTMLLMILSGWFFDTLLSIAGENARPEHVWGVRLLAGAIFVLFIVYPTTWLVYNAESYEERIMIIRTTAALLSCIIAFYLLVVFADVEMLLAAILVCGKLLLVLMLGAILYIVIIYLAHACDNAIQEAIERNPFKNS